MKRVQVTRTCKDCGKDFTYETAREGNRRNYCDVCIKRREAESARRKSRERSRTGERVTHACEQCGKDFTYTLNRRARHYCDDCMVLRRRASVAAHRAKRIAEGRHKNVPRGTPVEAVCARCGETYTYPSGTSKRTLCDPCRLERRRELAREGQARARERYRLWREQNPIVRHCELCGVELPAGKSASSRRRYCDPCGKEQRRQRALVKRELYELRRVGIMSLEERDAILKRQGGGCAICGRPEPEATTKGAWAKDHWHGCTKCEKGCPECFRGLLCGPCNLGIGFLQDDPEVVKKALRYLRRAGPKIGY